DEVGIIDRGKLVAFGNVQDIQKQIRGEKIIIVKVSHDFHKAVQFFEDDPNVGAISISETPNTLSFVYRGDENEQRQLLRNAINVELPILSFYEEETDLEDVFMEIMKGVG